MYPEQTHGRARSELTAFSAIWAYTPSQRRLNLRHRQYEGMTGADAETAMLRHGMAIAGISTA